MYLHNLLIFVGCLVSYVQCQTICKKNQYTVVNSDGSLSCLNCATCHDGRGLYPPCGSRIPYPPKPDCIACPEGKFSDELDSAPCHSCQICAEHEIVTAPCTSRSNRVCNGTCEAGFFYSKKDSTHSCQKCAYCCSDGKDEVISECVNQGSNASEKHCRPRPDKECSTGSSLPSPTDSLVGNEASESGSLSTTSIILIVLGVVSSVIIVTLVRWLYRTRKKPEERRVPVAESYNQNGPMTEPPNTASNAEMSAAFHKEPVSTTITLGGVNSGADLCVASDQAKQNAALSSVPSGSNSESVVRAPVELHAGKDNTNDKMSGDTPTVLNVPATDAAPPDGKVPISGDAVASDLKETTGGSLMRKLSRQLSKDSQRSDNEAGPGGRKRSPSTSSFSEMLKRKRSLSNKDEVQLVTNEEEDTDVLQGPIEIIEEPSPQEVKEGCSKLRLVFKCKVQGDSKLTYQWYKDGTELPGKNEDTLVLKSVMLHDFGLYTCTCVASCKDGSSYSKDSLPVEVDVTPRDGMTYKCLKDLDLNTQDRIEDLLSQKRYSVGGCPHIAFRYRMDQHKIKNLENDPEAGKKVLEYLGSSNPDLTVYEFCKTLKTREIKRLDIVKELLEHLSVPSSSNVYV